MDAGLGRRPQRRPEAEPLAFLPFQAPHYAVSRLPPLTRCLNCATPLQGGWCHRCGQRAEPNHRSLRHIVAELMENLTDADGRLWRTLRRLALQPARLTTDYIEGRRAAELPPLRLFFIALVLFFALGGVHVGADGLHPINVPPDRLAAQMASLPLPGRLQRLLVADIEHAAADPRAYLDILRDWSQRFAVLLLPLAAILLSLIFVFDRRHSVFDHTIFALHALTVGLLLLTVSVLVNRLNGAGSLLLLAIPVHLFLHLRGVYGTGRLTTLLCMALLAAGTLVGVTLLAISLAAVGLLLNGG